MTGTDDEQLTLLPATQWRVAEQQHQEAVDQLTAGHRARAGRGIPHPVEDFLFTYYSLRPAQLRRWYPGAGVALLDAPERLPWPFHRAISAPDVPGNRATGKPAMIAAPVVRQHRHGDAVAVDIPAFLAARRRQVDFTVRLLRATAATPGQFGCFGLHEWAMVFEQGAERRRHASWPLRLGQTGTDQVVTDHQIRCTHYDAFRFFTAPARSRNLVQPTLESRVRLEQPGCLHASMDVYKWAYKLTPVVPGGLLLECFRLAKSIRELDMRASPYDLADLGYQPVRIETAVGKAEYVAAQREFAQSAQHLRHRLLAVLEALDTGRNTGRANLSPD